MNKTAAPEIVLEGKVLKVHKKMETLSFPLKEVSPDTILEYRVNKIPTFVMKVDGKLYCSQIPDNINFFTSSFLGRHKCATGGNVCHRLSAASDEKGGCAKVRAHSRYIERYSWITKGFETFNTKYDSFVVVSCSHYEKCPPPKHRTIAEINSARLGLAQYVWDDVKTLKEVKERKEKIRNKTGRR